MSNAHILNEADLRQIDQLIKELTDCPLIDHVKLYQAARARRDEAISRMFEQGISWGEATGAHPILLQSQDKFEAAWKATKNDLSAQIEMIRHYLPKWFSEGEFPPPAHAMRIAIILRKAKERDREKQFLAAYLRNFRSRYDGSRSDEKLLERALNMGVVLGPIGPQD